MLRLLLYILAIISFVLGAFVVSSPSVNGHHIVWWILGLAFWAAAAAPWETTRTHRYQ